MAPAQWGGSAGDPVAREVRVELPLEPTLADQGKHALPLVEAEFDEEA